MCKCNPRIEEPYCGCENCEWPDRKKQVAVEMRRVAWAQMMERIFDKAEGLADIEFLMDTAITTACLRWKDPITVLELMKQIFDDKVETCKEVARRNGAGLIMQGLREKH